MKGCCEKLTKDFTEHPTEVGETYAEHLWCCIRTSASLGCIMFVLIIHGFFPFLFTKTGSTLIKDLHDNMQKRLANDKKKCCDTNSDT